MEGGSDGLVVAVHDIAPATLTDVRWLLARLDELGIWRRVLKVIPRASEADDVRRHLDHVARLTEAVASRPQEPRLVVRSPSGNILPISMRRPRCG